MKSCKEGSSRAYSPQTQQRKGEAMEDSVTWAGTTAAGGEVTEGRTGTGPGRRSWGGWQSRAAGRRAQLLGVERKTQARFSAGS